MNLKEEYPIAYDKLQAHIEKKIRDGFINDDAITKEFVETFIEVQVPKTIDNLVNNNPGAIIELLDENEIYCSILIKYVKGKPIFHVDINGAVYENGFNNRKEAMLYCVHSALKMLNDHKQDS